LLCNNFTLRTKQFGRQLSESSLHDKPIEFNADLGFSDEFMPKNEGTERRLRYEKLLRATIQPYPSAQNGTGGDESKQFEVTGSVLIIFHGSSMRMIHQISHISDEHCRRCFMFIHDGDSCDSPDGPGEPFYNEERFDENPWPTSGLYYAFNHASSVTKRVLSVTDGYDYEQHMNKTVIVYNKSGEREGCGVLGKPGEYWYKAWGLPYHSSE